MEYVNVEEIIARVKMHLMITTDSFNNHIEMFCFDAIRQLKDLRNYRNYVLRLEIVNRQAVLPVNFRMLNNLKIDSDENGCIYPLNITKSFPCLNGCNNQFENSYGYTFSVDGNFLNFSSDVKEDSCEVNYNGLIIDTNNRPVIIEPQIDGLVAYCKLMLLGSLQEYAKDTVRYARTRDEWDSFKLIYRSQSKQMTKEENIYIGRIWNNIIVKKSTLLT